VNPVLRNHVNRAGLFLNQG